MSQHARVVFGMPAYNRPDALARTLESLLSQTYGDFAIVIVDDKPTPEVQRIVETYAARYPRIAYEPNSIRLGMIGNWRKAFDRGRALYPESEYFAWVSDHDIWHPRWLEALVGAMDAHPQVVAAYPQIQRVYPSHRRTITRRFDTLGMTRPLDRVKAAARGMTAGNCIYGLFRARPLEEAGVFRPVLAPDRQILLQLLLVGEFHHVPEVLWYREVAGMFSYGRQREMFFPGGSPLYTYLPVTVQHFGAVLWHLAARGRGRPAIGRLAGAAYACAQIWYATKRELSKEDARWRVALDRTALGRWLRNRRVVDETVDAETAGDVAGALE